MSEHDFCRYCYKRLREEGAPSIIIREFAGDIYAESSDGKVSRMEGQSSIGCCRWAVKVALAEEWLTQREEEQNLEQPTDKEDD